MKPLRIKQLALVFTIFLIACQEDNIVETPIIDEDLEAASAVVDNYFNEMGGRSSSPDVSITILQYKNGKIYFNTNTDDIEEYQVVNETTVTAYVEPGEFVFWYRGNGLADVGDIDFDDKADTYLTKKPDEYLDLLWVLQVPHDYDPEHDELKYDIVYESKNNEGVVIRLDPKLKIIGGVAEADGPSEPVSEED